MQVCSTTKFSHSGRWFREPGRHLKQNNLFGPKFSRPKVFNMVQRVHSKTRRAARPSVLFKDSENEARSWPHGSVVSFSPFSCAGPATNILIAFALTATLGAAQEGPRPASAAVLGSLQQRRANLRPDLHPRPASFPSWKRTGEGEGGDSRSRPPPVPHRPQSLHAVGKYSSNGHEKASKWSRYTNSDCAHLGSAEKEQTREKLEIGCTHTHTHMLVHAEENISHTLTSHDLPGPPPHHHHQT